jgi:hypothetical protein
LPASTPPQRNGATSEQGRFSASFPSPPEADTETTVNAGFRIKTYTFEATSEDIEFVVSYGDLPDGLFRQKPASAFLDGAVDGAIANTHSKLLSHTEISLRGHAGREFRAQAADDLVMHARILLVGRRFYQIVVVTKTRSALKREVFKFLESFSLIADKAD